METLGYADELFEVQSEEELDIPRRHHQEGGRRDRIVRALGHRSALTGMAKDVAKQALPSIGQAVGGYFGGATGAEPGEKAASRASEMLGLELEGLSAQEAELEAAKGVIRMAGTAATVAAQAPRNAPPKQVARAATKAAAQRLAPGLVSGREPAPAAPAARRAVAPASPPAASARSSSGGASSQIAVASSGLPPWVADEQFGDDESDEPDYGNGYEPDYGNGHGEEPPPPRAADVRPLGPAARADRPAGRLSEKTLEGRPPMSIFETQYEEESRCGEAESWAPELEGAHRASPEGPERGGA